MPAKKKSKSKTSKWKSKTSKKKTAPRKSARKTASRKTPLKRKAPIKKAAKRRTRPKPASVSAERELQQEIRSRRLTGGTTQTRQSDFRGLSRAEEADSESVDELVEEGNIFEAGAVAGVEEADDSDEREVHTHEVSEDDVPDEYLEKD